MNNKGNRQKLQIGLPAALLCGIALLLAIGGTLFGGENRSQDSVQVAAVSGMVSVPVQAQEQDQQEDQQQVPQQNPYGVDPKKPMIALTFDDGPSKHTWTIVDALKAHNARATFFLLGSEIATHQAAIDYVLDNHNEVGSHSYHHKNLTKLASETEILDQIRPVDAELQAQHDYTPTLFRVPYGAKNEQVEAILKAEGKPMIGWSVDPYDWKVRDKDKVVQHVLNSVQDGDIVLMHDIYAPTAQAVAELVPALQERGFQLVTVSELFQLRGVKPQPGVLYRSVPVQTLD